jgi:putative ABC transport system permease protein
MAYSTLRLAGRTLRRHPGRTALMGLGFLIGTASITLTVATGQGARRAVEQRFRSMIGALDVLLVMQGGGADRAMVHLRSTIPTLTTGDAAAIARAVPNVRDVGGEQVGLQEVIEAAGRNGVTNILGTTSNWAAIHGDSLVAGSYYTDAEQGALARVAVLGADVAREYFGGNNAVGQSIRVRGVDLQVIGVLAPTGGAGGVGGGATNAPNLDNVVYVPLATSQRRLFNRDYLNLVSVKLVRRDRAVETQRAVEALLRTRHGKTGKELDDFRVMSPDAMIARVAGVDSMLRRALLWVGALALVIGGVVVANLIVAATVSRSREIGTRRAVGATRADVLRQFWAEAVLVATGAAVCGAAVAVALTVLGARAMRMPLVLSWPVTLGTVAATIAIGAVAGYFPARRAATVPPGVAMRDAG